MKENTISAFMLESYRLGELSLENKKAVEDALISDNVLRDRLEDLAKSDEELRLLYPYASLNLGKTKSVKFPQRRSSGSRFKISIGVSAGFAALAAVLLFLFLPAFNILRNNNTVNLTAYNDFTDRPKGQGTIEPLDVELFIYLKEKQDSLPDKSALREGNTVQLAYSAPAGAERYGVIFSIDGRGSVTMHYPYRTEQSSLLISGKRTFLNEAYTLDDAPDYEVFVFVVSNEPLNIEDVISGAEKMAGEAVSADDIETETVSAFAGCEVETITVLKSGS